MHPDATTLTTGRPTTDTFLFGKDGLTCGIVVPKVSVDIAPEMTSPYGLLLWPTSRFVRKESTMLFHPEQGLAGTNLRLVAGGRTFSPEPGSVRARWRSSDPKRPVVEVRWHALGYTVVELFFFADDLEGSTLIRHVGVRSSGEDDTSHRLEGIILPIVPNPYIFDGLPIEEERGFATSGSQIRLAIEGNPCGESDVDCELFERFITLRAGSTIDRQRDHSLRGTFSYWLHLTGEEQSSQTHPRVVDRRTLPNDEIGEVVRRCLTGMLGTIDGRGRFDASIFQYGYEWGQDAAVVAEALTTFGEVEAARSVLSNILERLTSDEGRIAESSRFRDGPMAELNANGALLTSIARYARATDDLSLANEFRDRITAIGDLVADRQDIAELGGIVGRRDLWERLPWAGMEAGFDIATHSYCARGLDDGAELLEMLDESARAERWRRAADTVARSMRDGGIFVDGERLVARRSVDGTVATTLRPTGTYDDARYLPYLPSVRPDTGELLADPDAVLALPIVHGHIPPDSPIAANTLALLDDHLWNATGIGGYLRSPLPSEPDAPGPWTFPTAWIAEAHLICGNEERAMRAFDWLVDIGGEATSFYEFYGPRRTPPFPPTGIIVWGWAQIALLADRVLRLRRTGSTEA